MSETTSGIEIDTTPDRERLLGQLVTLMAGEKTGDVLYALAQQLAATIAFAADDERHANALVGSFGEDMKKVMHDNWAYLRQQRGEPDREAARA